MGSADAGSGPEHGREDEPDEARYSDLPQVRVTVPDDARDLDADVRAYYRELKRRAAGLPGLEPPGPGLRPGPMSGPVPGPSDPMSRRNRSARILLGIVALMLVLSSLAMMVSPGRDRAPVPLPLASATSGADTRGLGEGLLLPDLRVRIGAREKPLRDLRPAVFALVPARCACQGELESVVAEAIGYQLDVYLVASPSPGTPGPDGRLSPADPNADGRAELQRLARSLGVSLLDEPSGLLAGGFADRGALTLVLVAADGTVAETTRSTSGLDLGLKLAEISRSDIVQMESAEPA